MSRLNNKGFSLVAIILMIVIVGIVGFTGWYVFNANHKNDKTLSSTGGVNPIKITSTPTLKDDTANWQTYQNEQFGFSFKYPKDVIINNKYSKYDTGEVLVVKAQNMQNIEEDMTLGYDKEYAYKDLEALKKGDPSIRIGMGSNYKILNISDALAKEFAVFGRIDMCTVVFNRTAVIYYNNNRMMLELNQLDNEKLKTANKKYFTTNIASCGENNLIWSSQSGGFYKDLVAGKTDAASQKWFTDFDKILGTFKFN